LGPYPNGATVIYGVPMATTFDDVDYPSWLTGSRESAAVVVPLLLDEIAPRSVVDVGCGLGAWLGVFSEHGVDDILGLDGPWVDQKLLEVAAAAFRVVDVREPLDLGRRFDLALCLEVAQLLEPSLAERLVLSLTSLSDVVVFSAAIPGQGGLGHLNEQWPGFWAELFAAHSYIAIDPLRMRLWDEPDVKWWFAQNTVCFVAAPALAQLPSLKKHVCVNGSPLRLVHPGCLGAVIDGMRASAPRARPSRLPWRKR
jgi:SAM-dependent methyltransferase